jgi:hypothetical protein
MRRRPSPARVSVSLAALAALTLAVATPLAASAATGNAPEPAAPVTDATSATAPSKAAFATTTDVELRVSAGLARSTDGDSMPMIDGYAVVRRGPLVLGLAAQRTYGVHSTETDTRLGLAGGVGWADDRFRATALVMAGVAWWDNRSWGDKIGREGVERTAFVGLRGDAEVRMFSVGAMKAYAGVWAAATIDASQERLAVPSSGDPEVFVKGQTRLMGGLQLGLTF